MSSRRRVLVRRAEPDDAASVAVLLTELGYPGNHVGEVRRRLAMWACEPAGAALVAECEGEVLGAVAVAATPYLERAGRRGRIVALVVSAQCRGQGIGRRLVEAAEKAAAELGCVTMEVTSARDRAESHAFYQSLGYEEWGHRSVRFVKEPLK